MSWAFLRHLVVVVVIWKNQNFQNFQTIQAFYIHNGTWQNSLSTTFNTARAWWTQIWFTPLVSWKEGLEYVKSLAHSLKLWCLGWEHERRRHVVRRAESAPPTSTTLSCAKAKCHKAALESWTEALEHPLPGKHCHFSDEQLLALKGSLGKWGASISKYFQTGQWSGRLIILCYPNPRERLKSGLI